jgi:hypothetical protein
MEFFCILSLSEVMPSRETSSGQTLTKLNISSLLYGSPKLNIGGNYEQFRFRVCDVIL